MPQILEKTGFVMDKPGDKIENDARPSCRNTRLGSPELHPLMAITPLNAASEVNRSNGDRLDAERNVDMHSTLPVRGIDDGFLTPGNAGGGREDGDSEQPSPRGGPREREDPHDREHPEREFPVGPIFPEVGHIPRGRGGVDINVYAHKKTLAQGMMDLALLSANANQLRYVLDTGPNHPYYYVGLVLISASIIVQLVVGVGLILNSRYNIRHIQDVGKANLVNNFTVLGIFFVTMLNVFISAFGVGDVGITPSVPGDSTPPERLVDS